MRGKGTQAVNTVTVFAAWVPFPRFARSALRSQGMTTVLYVKTTLPVVPTPRPNAVESW